MKVYLVRFLLLVLMAGLFWGSFREQKLFHIKEINITVNLEESDRVVWSQFNDDIEKSLGAYKGLPIWKISLFEARKKLKSYPIITDIDVQKSWPDRLDVSYTLPKLKAIHQTKNGIFKILAEDGSWVGPLPWSRLPSLPWINGEWIYSKPELKESLLSLLKLFPAEGSLSATQISEIKYSDLDGFLLTLIKTGQQIRFGTENFEIKSLRVGQVLDYLQSRGLESRVIDATFSKKVLVRLRNHP